jgi:predicted ArsR family transcriptional regulator
MTTSSMVLLFSRTPEWRPPLQFSTVFSVNTPDVPLGPRPASARPRQLSRAQARVLTRLQGEAEPTSLAALSAATGLHANTLREHLDALERSGLVRRAQEPPRGPGRPRTLYEAVADGAPGRDEYAGLAAVLAATIHRTSTDPQHDAAVAGEQWGHELAAAGDRPARQGGASARRAVVSMLDEIGFAPEADRSSSVVRLTRCPLLDTARRYPDIVCAVHLGIVRGALEEYGENPAPAELFPFSDPGACRLHLGGRR